MSRILASSASCSHGDTAPSRNSFPTADMSHTIPDHLESIHSISKTHLIDLNRKIGTGDTDALSSLLERARPNSQEPSIPAASLFRTLTLSSQDEASIPVEDSSTLLDMPSVGECAVHLELLEFFFALRSRIVNSSELDKTFGVEHKPKTVYRREYDSKTYKYNTTSHQVKNSGWEQQRREKWVYYLHMAVGRFMSWAEVADAAIKQESNSQSGTSLVHLPPCGMSLP